MEAEGRMTRPAINRQMREAIATRHGGIPGERMTITCAYCPSVIVIDWTGRRVRFLDELGRAFPELDHIEPIYWGGAHAVENIVPACLSCNRAKGPRRLGANAPTPLRGDRAHRGQHPDCIVCHPVAS